MGKIRRVAVIGGGASGSAAAVMAAREGALVTLFEQKERIGKKILSTGNGRCNFTNEYMMPECFRGEDTAIVPEVLGRFGTCDTLRFFAELGIAAKSKMGGYYYPKSEQAAAVAEVISMELERLGVRVLCNTKVTEIRKNKDFFIKTENGNFNADALILAAGGKAAPALGSDGSGYALAGTFGHTVTPVVPALTALHGKGTFFKQIAGVRADAKVSLFTDGRFAAEDTGELQLTGYGISGIPVFQVSRFAALALAKKQSVTARIDFMPDMELEKLSAFFAERTAHNPQKTAAQFLVGIFNRKLIPVLLRASGIREQTEVSKLTEAELRRLAVKCKTFEIEITDTNPFDQAQVCAGGVRTSEINSATMESLHTEGLYLVGELLDIDGICGGYNLQWAWATGYLAGIHAAKGKKYD